MNAHWRTVVIGMAALAVCIPSAASAQSLHDVLAFLLTNRSVPTDDFVRDHEAAAAASGGIADFLRIELGTLPVSTTAGGFTYRLDRTLGASVRTSDSFGPFFAERALTAGVRQVTLGVTYQQTSFERVDGRPLHDGTLVATASRFRGDTAYFDVETLSLQVKTDTMTVLANAGITDRLDVGVAAPLVRVTLTGQRVDTYRGRQGVQATAAATVAGFGDLILRAKYNMLRRAASGVAIGSVVRLPTGSEANLLGIGRAAWTPRVIASLEGRRVSWHGNAGYAFGGVSREFDYVAATTIAATPRMTFVGELTGRRLASIGRLIDAVTPHPTLADVHTVRLTTATGPTTRASAVVGVKWNVRSTWLLSASIVRPLTSAGLTARWTPTLVIDRSFGR